MKTVLITDTNIWIDLEHANLLGTVFQLPYRLVTPDIARKEMESPPVQMLEEMGLEFASLSPVLLTELMNLLVIHKRVLSVVDLGAYLLAREWGTTLLSGDKHLTSLAKSQGVSVHGVLWLLDELVSCQLIDGPQAADSLQCMLAHGARLPWDECNRRMKEWRK